MSDEKREKLKLREVFITLYPFLRPHLLWFLLGSFFILISTAVETVLPILVGKAVEVAIPGTQDLTALKKTCALFLGLIFLKAIVDTVQAYIIQKAGQGITHDLRSTLFEHIAALRVEYFDKNPTGRLLTRVINDIKSLSELFTASISVLALDILVIIGTIVAMFILHFKLAAMILSSFPLVIWTVIYFGKKQADAYREVRKFLSEINAFLGENISGIPTIQRLRAEKSRLHSFSTIVVKHQVAQNQSLRLFALVQPFANVLNGTAMAVLVAYGGYLVVQGEIGIGVVIAFLGYLRNLFQPVRDLVEKYNTFLSAYVSSERVVKILQERPEWVHDPVSRPDSSNPKSLEFKNVTFKYPNRKLPALENVSFDLQEGRSLAIVGATGSGKSSIVRLLLRFYEVTAGSVWVGGREIKEWNRKDLRNCFGMIHQEVYLFAGSLRENLLIGREKIQDDETLIRHCRTAQLWEVVKDRGGLDFQVFEGGSNLSLGEKQLVNFARILILNPHILIFDEATSSIDPALEDRVMKAFANVLKGRTSIAIAHRLSTIEACDEIVVMEKGNLVERGEYRALLKRNGTFARFHQIYANH